MTLSRRYLILLAAVGFHLARAADVPIAPIPVVHTWGELLAAKPIVYKNIPPAQTPPQEAAAEASKSWSVWVGMDRDHVDAYGAVLLYCAAKEVSSTIPLETGNYLGPLAPRVEWPDSPGNALLPALYNLAQGGYYHSKFISNDSSYVLFVKSISFAAAANYPVRLLLPVESGPNEKRIVLAETEVVVAGDPIKPWTPWGQVAPEGVASEAGAWGEAGLTVWSPKGGIAIPKAQPNEITISPLPAPAQLLPHLFPGRADAPIRLTRNGNTFLVQLNKDQSYEGFPDEFFLTRWWLNDKLWMPDPKNIEQITRAEQMAFSPSKKARFHLDFLPERLGAKKGDRIGLQVLYCPWRWEYSGPQQAVEQVLDSNPRNPPTSFSFVSNRVNFIYSGDPHHL